MKWRCRWRDHLEWELVVFRMGGRPPFWPGPFYCYWPGTGAFDEEIDTDAVWGDSGLTSKLI